MKTKVLHDEDLEQISGGMTSKEKREYYKKITCPSCGADANSLVFCGAGYSVLGPTETFRCKLCNCTFNIKAPI